MIKRKPRAARLPNDPLDSLIGTHPARTAVSLLLARDVGQHRVRRFREEKRERFLSDVEYQRLGAALKEIEVDGSETASAIAAVRLLMLTGCRLSEIQKLHWEHVD